MRRRGRVVLAGAVAWCVSLAVPGGAEAGAAPSAGRAVTAGVWGKAIEVPGTGALNKGGNAQPVFVSCPSAGNCGGGGAYFDGTGDLQVFVVSERNGVWRKAIEMPGSAALNKGGAADLVSLSCASAGNCAAGGFYSGGPQHQQAFVVNERQGVWGKAIKVPGTAALNTGEIAQLETVSCPSAGNCAAAGDYFDGSSQQAFVVSERHGVWRKAITVPGLRALNTGGIAMPSSVSCASAGNCAVGGIFTDRFSHQLVFVVSDRNGVWGKAIEVPGSGALNTRGAANLDTVSCPSAGNCVAAGDYWGRSGHQAFVVSERHGVWGKAIKVPGLRALNTRGAAEVVSVSCPSAGNCSAGGFYTNGPGQFHTTPQAFVVSERNGVWRKAIEVPGTAALNQGGEAGLTSVSCPSAGNCAAGGDYTDGSHHQQAFVVSERHGVWRRAIKVPGSGTLNATGLAEVTSVSCALAGNCAAGGDYVDASGNQQAFVVSER